MAFPPQQSDKNNNLANSLQQVVDDHAQQGRSVREKWYKDDHGDVALTGLVLLYTSICVLIELNVTKNNDLAVDVAFLLLFSLLSVLLFFSLRDYSFKERRRVVNSLIAKLRNLPSEDSSPNFPERRRNFHSRGVPTLRNNTWRRVPNNLLLPEDIIALQNGQRAPCDVINLISDVFTRRDELVVPTPPEEKEKKKKGENHVCDLFDVELFQVQSSPLVSDVTQFLHEYNKQQDTTQILQEIKSAGVHVRLASFLIFVIFGLGLNSIRLTQRPDGFSWSHLLLTRPATLLCLLPPLSWSLVRFLFEIHWSGRFFACLNMNDRSFFSITKHWLFPLSANSQNKQCMPLPPSTLIRIMGSVSALSALDEENILIDHAVVEEMFLLKGESHSKVIDCCLDNSAAFGLRFEDPQWETQIDSLKPIGLCCGIAAQNSSFHPAYFPEEEEEEDDDDDEQNLSLLYQQRPSNEPLKQLSLAMGFRMPEDLNGFAIKARCTIVGQHDVVAGGCRLTSVASFHKKPIIECVVTEVPVWQRANTVNTANVNDKGISSSNSNSNLSTISIPQIAGRGSTNNLATSGVSSTNVGLMTKSSSINSTSSGRSSNVGQYPTMPSSSVTNLNLSIGTGAGSLLSQQQLAMLMQSMLHLLCWGHPSLLLDHCSEYWDGQSIWSLDEESRKQVIHITEQWMKEDFDCCAFAYAPMTTLQSNQFLTRNELTDVFIRHPTRPVSLSSATPPSRSVTPPMTTITSNSFNTPTLAITPFSSLAEVESSRVNAICSTMARGLIFTGLIASRDQPRSEMSLFIENLHKAGIRFVYYSPRDARRSRKMAEKMGLETDWNTSISLREVNGSDVSPPPQSARLPPTKKNSTSQLLDDVADWELKAHMPRGIESIVSHLKEVDDVPLRVSVFTDSAPDTVSQMIHVMRDYKEVVVVFGSPFGGDNARACMSANAAIAIVNQDTTELSEEDALSISFGKLPCSFTLENAQHESRSVIVQLLGIGRVALFNYRQANQALMGLSLIVCASQCAVFCTSAPDVFTISHVLWLTWMQIPLLCVPVALRPRHRQNMLRERMPWRESILKNNKKKYRILRFTVYAIIRLIPVSIFVCGMFFWALIILIPPEKEYWNWGKLPGNVSLTINDNDPQVIGAQAVALLTVVWSGCFVSSSFASRTESEYRLEGGYWIIWTGVVLVVIALQLLYNCLFALTLAGRCLAAFPKLQFQVWIVLVCAPPIFVPLFAYPVKRHDRKFYSRDIQMLRLDFETKLGQFSPI